jgi:hypothetical protein
MTTNLTRMTVTIGSLDETATTLTSSAAGQVRFPNNTHAVNRRRRSLTLVGELHFAGPKAVPVPDS